MTGTRAPTAPALVAAIAAVLAACASDQPAQVLEFDDTGGRAVVTLLGDEFARLDGERMPIDAAVLRLRLRTRAMAPADLARFVVRVEVDPAVPESAEERVLAARNRVVQALNVMEVGQVENR
jgi:hypothetical protein